MSFSMTTEAYRNRTKTVTRRLGWTHLKPGMRFMGVEKAMGLKRGEKVQYLHAAEVVSNEPEHLFDIVRRPVRGSGIPEVVLEGFPGMTAQEFVAMFRQHNAAQLVRYGNVVRRIEFRHLGVWHADQSPLIPEAH